MGAVIFSVTALLIVLGAVAGLIPLGLRAGDQPGDALLLAVEPRMAPRGASVTVTNPGRAPVILGMSLRRAGARLRVAGPSYVRIRTGSTRPELLADQHAWLGVLGADETRTLVVRADAQVRERGELVAVIGQQGRLRTIHRLVVLGSPSGLRARRRGALDARPPLV
jgi:hypothetical protein